VSFVVAQEPYHYLASWRLFRHLNYSATSAELNIPTVNDPNKTVVDLLSSHRRQAQGDES
jgi:hypothetical protein